MTNKVQSVLIDVCRTEQGLNVKVKITIKNQQIRYACLLSLITKTITSRLRFVI